MPLDTRTHPGGIDDATVRHPRRLLTLPEVATALRVSVATLRNWRAQGKIAMVRLPGGGLRVERAEAERLAGGPL
jgi:excisionase family DNA binding protein